MILGISSPGIQTIDIQVAEASFKVVLVERRLLRNSEKGSDIPIYTRTCLKLVAIYGVIIILVNCHYQWMWSREVYTIKCLQPTGASVMFWGCVSALSVGHLVKRDWQILIYYAISTRKQA